MYWTKGGELIVVIHMWSLHRLMVMSVMCVCIYVNNFQMIMVCLCSSDILCLALDLLGWMGTQVCSKSLYLYGSAHYSKDLVIVVIINL